MARDTTMPFIVDHLEPAVWYKHVGLIRAAIVVGVVIRGVFAGCAYFGDWSRTQTKNSVSKIINCRLTMDDALCI